MPDAHDDVPDGTTSHPTKLPSGVGVFLGNMMANVPSARWEWREPQLAASKVEAEAKSLGMNCWAVRDKTGKLWGYLLSDWKESLDAGSLPLLGELLRLDAKLAAAEERAARAEELASVDPLTGLPNRRAWEQALAREERRCQRAQHPAAIVCLDLDRLKEQNDRAGHASGDELLQRTADCLRRAIRAHDIAARLGGDEFGILLVECVGDCVPQIVARLNNGLQAAGVEATIGWAARTTAADLHATWQAADQALIAAKHS